MDAWYQPYCGGTENQRIISMIDYFLHIKKCNVFNVILRKEERNERFSY